MCPKFEASSATAGPLAAEVCVSLRDIDGTKAIEGVPGRYPAQKQVNEKYRRIYGVSVQLNEQTGRKLAVRVRMTRVK